MQVVKAPDPRLRAETKKINVIKPDFKKTVDQMIKLTKTFVDPEGVGLASTQVGLDGKFFVAKMDDGSFKAFVNPRIIKLSKKTKVMLEGCLSIPNYWVHKRLKASKSCFFYANVFWNLCFTRFGLVPWVESVECRIFKGNSIDCDKKKY